jgi:hypothetical protein
MTSTTKSLYAGHRFPPELGYIPDLCENLRKITRTRRVHRRGKKMCVGYSTVMAFIPDLIAAIVLRLAIRWWLLPRTVDEVRAALRDRRMLRPRSASTRGSTRGSVCFSERRHDRLPEGGGGDGRAA